MPLSLDAFLSVAGLASVDDAPSVAAPLPLSLSLAAALSGPPESAVEPLSAAADAALDAEREAVLRSFFAQPLPLKWIVGAEKAFRTGDAWQIGQAVGPSALSEWMTSKRWPFGQR